MRRNNELSEVHSVQFFMFNFRDRGQIGKNVFFSLLHTVFTHFVSNAASTRFSETKRPPSPSLYLIVRRKGALRLCELFLFDHSVFLFYPCTTAASDMIDNACVAYWLLAGCFDLHQN